MRPATRPPLAVLQQTVRRAMAVLPHAPRGSLLIREGDRFVARALVGFDAPPGFSSRVPVGAELADGGPRSARRRLLTPRTRAASSMRGRGTGRTCLSRSRRAAASPKAPGCWSRPSSSAASRPAISPSSRPPWSLRARSAAPRSSVLAGTAGDALERHRLYDDKASAAQEIRLFERLLHAVGTTLALHDLIETIAHGIKSVQLDPSWNTVEIWLLEEDRVGDGPGLARGDLCARVYRAPASEPTTYFQNVRAGADSAARPLGVSIDWRTGHGGDGEGSQRALLDEAIGRRMSGIIIAPSNPESAEEAFPAGCRDGHPGRRDRHASDPGQPGAALHRDRQPGVGQVGGRGDEAAAPGRRRRRVPRRRGARAERPRARRWLLGGGARIEPHGAADDPVRLGSGGRDEARHGGARGAVRRRGAFGAAADNGRPGAARRAPSAGPGISRSSASISSPARSPCSGRGRSTRRSSSARTTWASAPSRRSTG